ncbi:MAG: zinc-dependent metalloprotease, partial [Gemmatimonadota bacterium]|nr:zinc-dependent metalloprotease [Gemmatimonadota bacterium]
GHVAAIIGGSQSQERYGTGPRFKPMSKARQRDAMRFLDDNAFQTPTYFIDKDILMRIEQEGFVAQLRGAQNQVLSTLLNENRLNRLLEHEALATNTNDVYRLGDLLADMRQGIWSELSAPSPKVDIFRRNLQRAYLEAMDRDINPPATTAIPFPPGFPQPPQRFTTDVRPLLRGELVELDKVVGGAIGRSTDSVTRLHLQDVRLQIAHMLDSDRRK